MKFSNDIILDNISTDNLNPKEQRAINIASLNLKDFNSKISPDKCQIKYHTGSFKFSEVNSNDNSKFITQQINHFVKWDVMSDDQSWKKGYINSISNTHYNNINSLLSTSILRKEFSQTDFDYVIKQTHIFKTRFQNYYPKGFLNSEQEQFISDELNTMCKEIDLKIKTYESHL